MQVVAVSAVVATSVAVCAAMVVFGGVVVLGAAIVRWLRLPQELPDELRFAPPPPPVRGMDDPGDPHAIALAQGQRLAMQRQALACVQQAHEVQELAAFAAADLREAAGRAAAPALAAAADADAVRGEEPTVAEPRLTAAAAAIRAAREAVIAIVGPPPTPSTAHLWVLCGVLIVVVGVWVVVLSTGHHAAR